VIVDLHTFTVAFIKSLRDDPQAQQTWSEKDRIARGLQSLGYPVGHWPTQRGRVVGNLSGPGGDAVCSRKLVLDPTEHGAWLVPRDL
jgi:hypothetical protein